MRRRVRVLRIIARMNVGGPAVQVSTITRDLDPARFESLVLCGRVPPGEADYLELRAPDVPVSRLASFGPRPNPVDDLLSLWEIRRHLVAFRPDIVHTHTAKAGVLGRLAAWSTGRVKTVHTFHGHLLHGYFRPSVHHGIVLTERTLARRTDRLVAVGERVRDDLLAAGIGTAGQYSVVPPGLSLPDGPSVADARAMLGLPSSGLVVGYVGRLTGIKRPDRLAEVAGRVLRARGDVTFAVVGDGPLAEELRRLTAPLGDRFRMFGWRADVEVLYAASDLVVLTSDNEGMPVSLIEAALAARPAVGPSVGSTREVVIDGETGLVCPPRAADLSDALLALLADEPLRQRMGLRARERAIREFGADRLVADTAALYEQLVGTR